jgi:hypothetical protein
MCRSLEFFLAKERKNVQKNCFLGRQKFCKEVFLRKNLWELLDARVLHVFEEKNQKDKWRHIM